MKQTKQERKVYPMKMKKFIPLLALSMMFTVPAFAEVEETSMSSTLSFLVGDYFRIHRGTEVVSATAALTAQDYTTLNLDKALVAQYIVYTNKVEHEKLTLKGTVTTTGTDVNALYGTGSDDLWLIFGNTTNLPTDASIAACRTATDPTGANNPNAIVLKLNPNITKTAGSGDGSAISMTEDYSTNYRVKYDFNNGIYTFTYTTAQEAKANTFSTADTAGTYQAILNVTRNGA